MSDEFDKWFNQNQQVGIFGDGSHYSVEIPAPNQYNDLPPRIATNILNSTYRSGIVNYIGVHLSTPVSENREPALVCDAFIRLNPEEYFEAARDRLETVIRAQGRHIGYLGDHNGEPDDTRVYRTKQGVNTFATVTRPSSVLLTNSLQAKRRGIFGATSDWAVTPPDLKNIDVITYLQSFSKAFLETVVAIDDSYSYYVNPEKPGTNKKTFSFILDKNVVLLANTNQANKNSVSPERSSESVAEQSRLQSLSNSREADRLRRLAEEQSKARQPDGGKVIDGRAPRTWGKGRDSRGWRPDMWNKVEGSQSEKEDAIIASDGSKELSPNSQQKPDEKEVKTSLQKQVDKTKEYSKQSPEYHSSRYITDALEAVEPRWGLDDIGGLHAIKEILREIAQIHKDPDTMQKWGVVMPKGVLFYGDPGTGKNMLAHALANETESEFWVVDGASLYDMWLSLSTKNTKEMFTKIKQHEGRLVVFIDEIESVIGIEANANDGASRERNQVAGIFKQELNNLPNTNPNTLIVAATNNIDSIDPSLIRSGRFDYKLHVPSPDDQGRREIIANIITSNITDHDISKFSPDIDILALVKETNNMTGADINDVFQRLFRRKALEESKTGQVEAISNADIIAIIFDKRTG